MDTWKEVENLPKELWPLKYAQSGKQFLNEEKRWELFKKSNECKKLEELKESLLRNAKNLVKD